MQVTTSKIALLIGNDQNADPRLAELAVPAADVCALRGELEDPAICGFEVQDLHNADKGAIESAIDDLFEDRQRDDRVLFYFSGHGLLDADGELFLALPRSRRERLLSNALPASYLRCAMGRSRSSRRQVIVLDCCYSGVFAKGRPKGGAADGIGRLAVTERTFDPKGYDREIEVALAIDTIAAQGIPEPSSPSREPRPSPPPSLRSSSRWTATPWSWRAMPPLL